MHKPKFNAALALASAALIAAGCASFEENLAKAKAGDPEAQYLVAEAYAQGEETPKDPGKAEEYFKASLRHGNRKAERALVMLYLENGKIEHYDEVVGKLERVAEGDGWHFGMDAEMLKKAPAFATALAKNGEFKKFKTFDKTVRDIALRMFHCPSAGIPYDNFVSSSEIREYERATAPAESFVYQSERKEEERAKKAQAEMEERIALEQRKREEEEARKEAEKAKRSFEEDFSKLCKLDTSKALDKIKDMLGKLERGCASIEFEEYEIQFEQEDPGRDWLKSFLERKLVDLTGVDANTERRFLEERDNADFKFPLNADFPSPLDFYKEIKTGASLEWTSAYLYHGSFSNVQFRASDEAFANALAAAALRYELLGERNVKINPGYIPSDYLNPTNVVFWDDTREVSLYFGSVAPDKPQILVSGMISFKPTDITEDALVEKYRKTFPSAGFSTNEETIVEGGGTVLGLPVPKRTKRYSISSFSSGKATVSIRSLAGVTVDHVTPLTGEKHHVDENGQYSGSINDALSDPLAYIGTGELEGESAIQAINAWTKANEEKGSATVTITDGPLSEACTKAYAEAKQRSEEKAKHEAEEAEKKRRALEAERAESF